MSVFNFFSIFFRYLTFVCTFVSGTGGRIRAGARFAECKAFGGGSGNLNSRRYLTFVCTFVRGTGGRIRAGARFAVAKLGSGVSHGTQSVSPRRSIFAFCASRRKSIGYPYTKPLEKSKMRTIGHHSSHLFCKLTITFFRFLLNNRYKQQSFRLGFFSYKVAQKHLCRFLCACTRKDTSVLLLNPRNMQFS